jgi:hypothetical protein
MKRRNGDEKCKGAQEMADILTPVQFRRLTVPTLFGEWAMVREWGRVGSLGRLRESWFATEKIANQAAISEKKEAGTRI